MAVPTEASSGRSLPNGAAIEAVGLSVRCGALAAVDGVDLRVGPGEVVALLGPNGAGKTTTVETLLGYRRPDAGRARVLGCDPVSDHRRLVRRVGAMLQTGGVWPSLPAREALALYASYYDAPEDPAALLERLDLGACARTPWRRLSGGEQQRLSLAIALLPRPDALFLDEPTAGVDPIGRRVVREVVAAARGRGAAVLLTTHDLADVEAVADAAVILHHGRVRAAGTLAALTSGGTTFRSAPGLDAAALGARVGAAVAEGPPGEYRVDAVLDAAGTAALAGLLDERGATLDRLSHGTSLEDRYLEIVGEPAALAEPRVSALAAQSRAEVRMTLRRGESLLLTIGIPVGLLVFFSTLAVLTVPGRRVDFVTPGILALCVLSTAMVSLGIATGFERGYGVLKRLYVTPLGRGRLLAAKVGAVGVVEVLQVVVVCLVAVALAWHPHATAASTLAAVAAGIVATVAFGGIGLTMAGRLRPEANLAAANGLYLVLLLLSGIVVPLSRLPSVVADIARCLPSTALASALRGALAHGALPSPGEWGVLFGWAVGAAAAAAATFRFDPPR